MNRFYFLLFLILSHHLVTSQEFEHGIDKNDKPVFNQYKSACHTADSFDLVDQWPLGIAYDGSHFWHTSHKNSIMKYDSSGQLVDSIPVPAPMINNIYYSLSGIFADQNFIWTLSEQLDSIYKMDKTTGQVLHKMKVPFGLDGFGICKMGSKLYATRYAAINVSGFIFELDTLNGAIIDTLLRYSAAPPHRWLGLAHHNGYLYCVGNIGLSFNVDNVIYKIDPSNGNYQIFKTTCLPYITGLTVKDDYLWVVSSEVNRNGRQKAYKIDSMLQITTNIESVESPTSSIALFPNPSHNGFTVESEFLKISQIQILTIEGKTLYNAAVDDYRFKYSEVLNSGLFIVQLMLEDGTLRIEKLIHE